MTRTSGATLLAIEKTSRSTVDEQIQAMAHRKMSDVVVISEGIHPTIGVPKKNPTNAATYLVCRLFTDAVFSQDIRAIQLIISRIDGGLPKDVEVDSYQTEFGDCLSQVLAMTDGLQLKVMPDDTVMMALCKSLYDLSVQDIYWDFENGRKKKPSTDKKQERDAALRMILERTGGRKTLSAKAKEAESVEMAGWIEKMLPNGGEEMENGETPEDVVQ